MIVILIDRIFTGTNEVFIVFYVVCNILLF